MSAGAPRRAEPKRLYVLAAEVYRDLIQLAEGECRWRPNHQEYEWLKVEPKLLLFSPEQEAKLAALVEKELRSGRTKSWRKAERLQDLRRWESVGIMTHLGHELAREQKHFPGEPDVLRVLLSIDTTPDQIRELCKEAFMTMTDGAQEVVVPAWPIAPWSVLPRYLSEYVEKFIAAKSDPRYPRCDVSRRPTNLRKQLWFLARALAGAELRVEPSTATDVVGATRPEQVREREEEAWQALIDNLSLHADRTFVP